MSEMKERFQRDLAEVSWRDLRIHLQRDVIVTVAAELDLVAVAMAVAGDDQQQVAAWIAAGQLGKPTLAQIEDWERQLDTPFRLLIVQPFILVQALHHG